MNQTTRPKLAVDLGMAVLLFVRMVYQLTGDFAHEWAGAARPGLMVSGIILSRHVFGFLPISGGAADPAGVTPPSPRTYPL